LIFILVSDFQRSVWSVPSISVAVLALAHTAYNYVDCNTIPE
jgi:hypothetical protein